MQQDKLELELAEVQEKTCHTKEQTLVIRREIEDLRHELEAAKDEDVSQEAHMEAGQASLEAVRRSLSIAEREAQAAEEALQEKISVKSELQRCLALSRLRAESVRYGDTGLLAPLQERQQNAINRRTWALQEAIEVEEETKTLRQRCEAMNHQEAEAEAWRSREHVEAMQMEGALCRERHGLDEASSELKGLRRKGMSISQAAQRFDNFHDKTFMR